MRRQDCKDVTIFMSNSHMPNSDICQPDAEISSQMTNLKWMVLSAVFWMSQTQTVSTLTSLQTALLRRNEGCLGFPKNRWLYRVTRAASLWCLEAPDIPYTCITAGLCLCHQSSLQTHQIFQVCDVPGSHTCTKIYLILPQLSGILHRHMATMQCRFINHCFQDMVHSLHIARC